MLSPPAIICSDMIDAPAEVPATVAPAALRRRIFCATAVPPRIVERRSWLPPVRKMPDALSSISR